MRYGAVPENFKCRPVSIVDLDFKSVNLRLSKIVNAFDLLLMYFSEIVFVSLESKRYFYGLDRSTRKGVTHHNEYGGAKNYFG
jgi:hypothetical protein